MPLPVLLIYQMIYAPAACGMAHCVGELSSSLRIANSIPAGDMI
jgi:hypothetical protein